MKASDYLNAKRAEKHRKRDRRFGSCCYAPPPPPIPRVVPSSNTSMILSGSIADIDTPQKRHAIAAFVLGLSPELAAKFAAEFGVGDESS